MTTDVVNTIVASDEKNVNKFDKDRSFSQTVDADNALSHSYPDANWILGSNWATVHRIGIIHVALEIRLRLGY